MSRSRAGDAHRPCKDWLRGVMRPAAQSRTFWSSTHEAARGKKIRKKKTTTTLADDAWRPIIIPEKITLSGLSVARRPRRRQLLHHLMRAHLLESHAAFLPFVFVTSDSSTTIGAKTQFPDMLLSRSGIKYTGRGWAFKTSRPRCRSTISNAVAVL